MGPYPLEQVNQYLEQGSLLPTDSDFDRFGGCGVWEEESKHLSLLSVRRGGSLFIQPFIHGHFFPIDS